MKQGIAGGRYHSRASAFYGVLVLMGIFLVTGRGHSSTPQKPTKSKTDPLQKAYRLYQEKKFTALGDWVQSRKSDKKWGDYYRWLATESLLASKKKNRKKLIHQEWMEIEKDFPASAVLAQKSRSLMLADIQEESSLSPLTRIDQARMWNHLPASSVGDIAKFCSAHPDQLAECQRWGDRMAEIYPTNTVEYANFSSYITKGEEKKKAKDPKPVVKKKKIATYSSQDELNFLDAIQEYKDENFRSAEDILENFPKKYPDSKHEMRARFWYAKVLKQRGKKEESRKAFEYVLERSPLSWYGTLSSMETGISIREKFNQKKLREFSETADEIFKPIDREHWTKANTLLAMGVPALAKMELGAIKITEEDSFTRKTKIKSEYSDEFLYTLARTYHSLSEHQSAFVIVQELLDRNLERKLAKKSEQNEKQGPEEKSETLAEQSLEENSDGIYNPETLEMVFPVSQHDDTIKGGAAESNLDFFLVKSLIKQESAFNPEVVSPSNALSLMQVKHGTACDVEKKITRTELFDPTNNVRVGCKYLASLMKKFSGKIALVLTGYNAGPYQPWIKSLNESATSMELYVEQIPFEETRKYVGTIFRNYVWYKLLYENTEIKDLTAFWTAKETTQSTEKTM